MDLIKVCTRRRATSLALLLALLPVPAFAVNFTRNVGIGTTSPFTTLAVKQHTNSHLGAGISIARSDTTDFSQIFTGGDNYMYLMAPSNQFKFTDKDANVRMTLQADGDLYLNAPSGADTDIFYQINGTKHWRLHGSSNTQFYVFDAQDDNGVYIAQNTNSWASLSDERLKENVEQYSVLDRLATSSYRTVSFDWKRNGQHDIGVIAQEIYQIFPEVVNVGNTGELDPNDPTNGSWGVMYDKLGALALEGVKELNAKVDSQAAEIEALRLSIADQGAPTASRGASNKSSFSSKLRSIFATLGSWFAPVSVASERAAMPVSKAKEAEVQDQDSAEADSLTIGSPERPAGFTMYDIHDGRPHCVYVNGGNLLPVLGTCEETDVRLFGQN